MTTSATPPVVEPVVPPAVPPAAPAAPATPAPAAPATPPAEPAKAESEKWEASGDAFVDTLANGYLAKGGSVESFQALLEDVAETGSLTAAAKVELHKAFGDMADALIPTIEQKAKENKEWVTAERNAIYTAAGSEAAFNEMREWAKSNLDDKTRAFLTASLELGGTSAQLAVAQLKEHMIKQGATVTDTTHKVNGAPAATGGHITLAEYIQENAKAQRAGDSSAVESLKARANAAMAAAKSQGRTWR